MMRIPTKGSLAETNLIAILNECAENGTIGMVRAESGSAIKVVYLQNGSIAYASSNDRSDRLTEVLKRAGKLTQEQIDHAQERVKPGVSLGKTLVELGFLTSKELLWGAKMQVEGIIHHLLFWKEGSYQILQGPLPKEIVSLNISAYQIIFSGIIKSTDRRWVLEQIGSPEAVYGLSEEFHLKNANYRLPIETIASRINGKRTLNEIAQSAGADAFEVCKTIAALELLGMAKRMKEKPLQIPLMVEEAAPNAVPITEETQRPVDMRTTSMQDISLGEILQIPTVEELQKEVEEKNFEPSSVSNEAPLLRVDKAESVTEPGKSEQEASADETEMQSHVVFVPHDIPERPSRGIFGIDSRRAILLIGASVLLGVVFFLFLNYLLGGSPNGNKKEDLKLNTAVSAAPKPVSIPAPKVDPPSPGVMAKSGQLQEASLIWKNSLSGEKTKYTLQLILACQEKTVLDTMYALGDLKEVMIVPADFKGHTCYRMIYGTYASEEDAVLARTNLPPSIEKRRIHAQVVPIVRILQ